MSYISLETLISARKDIKHRVSKPEQFFGIILFLLCTCETKLNGNYLKINLKRFSEYADNAFYFSEKAQVSQEGFYYALLKPNWKWSLRNKYFKKGKIPLQSFVYCLLWTETEKKVRQFVEGIPQDIKAEFFIGKIQTTDFDCAKPIHRQDLLKVTGNTFPHLGNSYTKEGTLNFNDLIITGTSAGSFTGGSPFTTELFFKTASKGIGEILLTYDFDIFEGHGFLPNSIEPSGQGLENKLSKPELLINKVKAIKVSEKSSNKSISKPFLLLAGISGTGKTRFVREQAIATGSISDTYCLTPVRPDWHEPSDILGYISRLSGEAEYVPTEILQFIAKAWRAIIDAGLGMGFYDAGNRFSICGENNQLRDIPPYWLCLDEMNLAPVEQYFADYLSILETREWQWQGNEFDYFCDPLLTAATIQQLEDKAKNKLRKNLGFEAIEYDTTWEIFCDYGFSIPFNLIVAGTVNMDETTHGFSRKVIDRALSFDFGSFFPNDFDHFFESKVTHNALSYPIYSHSNIDDLPMIDSEGSKSIEFLKAISQVLDNTPFQLAFRALNELLLAVISTRPTDEQQLQAVWDDFLMQKVLPRIEGDYDKLAIINKITSSNEQSLLTELTITLEQKLVIIWPKENESNKLRIDLYRKNEDGSALSIACRSEAKLSWMQDRLERSGFTSFWP